MTIAVGQLGCTASEDDELAGAGGKTDHIGEAADAGPGPAGGESEVPGLDTRPQNVSCMAVVPPAAKLSATGCVDANQPTEPAPGLIPFAINSELWSDGAVKERHLALPEEAQIAIDDDGDFSFPPGTVLKKEFSLAGRRIETRLLIRAENGAWSGFSYEWDENQSDAALLSGGKTVTLSSGQAWRFPSSFECTRCHNPGAGHVLGPELAQLNRSFHYAATGRSANQVTTWSQIGLFSNPPALPPDELPRLADPRDDDAPVSDRARAYLHANCSHCHRPAPGACPGDLRFATPFAEMQICQQRPPLGGFGFDGHLLTPGDTELSLIYNLMGRRGFAQMPPLATSIVDEAGLAVIGEWIDSLTRCD
jgi:uncharacterized repeat protein (TIGR03806 family)